MHNEVVTLVLEGRAWYTLEFAIAVDTHVRQRYQIRSSSRLTDACGLVDPRNHRWMHETAREPSVVESQILEVCRRRDISAQDLQWRAGLAGFTILKEFRNKLQVYTSYNNGMEVSDRIHITIAIEPLYQHIAATTPSTRPTSPIPPPCHVFQALAHHKIVHV